MCIRDSYQYNIKLAEGLPDPDIEVSFITNHKEKSDFQTSALNYLIDLFDYPIVKIRHLAMESLFHLYGDSQQLFHDYALKELENKSANLIEHFLILLH